MPPLRSVIFSALPVGTRRALSLLALSTLGALVASSAQARLLVSDTSGNQISLYNGGTGAFVAPFVPAGSGGLQSPDHLALGPDGNLYVADPAGVLRYDGRTGLFLDTFILSGTGLDHPSGLAFGPDGNLYVGSAGDNAVLRYNGSNGTLIDSFVPAGTGGLQSPSGLAFGPDGSLYVSSAATNSVLRYDGKTGAFLGAFVPAGTGGLNTPADLVFGPDGNLYLSSAATDSVLRYDGRSGAFLDTFVAAGSGGLDQPEGLTFAPDGNLYVASRGSHNILRFSGKTGRFLSVFVPATGSGSTPGSVLFTLDAPSGLSATPVPISQIRLSWTDNSDDETAFAVWRKGDGRDWTRIGVVPPNFTTFMDTSVTPGQSYTYRVRAISNTVASAWTSELNTTLQPAPAAPTHLTFSVLSNTQAQLSWTDNSDNETAFAVYRKDGSLEWRRVAVLRPRSTTFIDSGLTPGISYTYLVRATNNTAASAWTNRITVVTGTAPAAPTDLAVSLIAGTQVQLTWTDNSDNETAFAIWRHSAKEEWHRIAVVRPNTTQFVDVNVAPGTSYTYLVRATNNVGPSDWTDQVSMTIAP